MNRSVVVIGAGMGGLTAAIRLARLGFHVRVIEARAEPGGLASAFEAEGFAFDAGPYILLDRPGLEWAFHALDLDLADRLELRRIENVYEVAVDGADEPLRFHADVEKTGEGFERLWPGSGLKYKKFVNSTARAYQRIKPLLFVSRPGLRDILRTGAWLNATFLMHSLEEVLKRAGLPRPLMEAVAIWTHVAGQAPEEAPSPLAFVPALIHTTGAYYPVGGISAIPRVLARVAEALGVQFQYNTRVRAICTERGRVLGVETDEDESLPASAVVSNYSGVGTYLELTDATPPQAQEELRGLPLQSPGVCAYLAVKPAPAAESHAPYLRFVLPGREELCRLLIMPSVVAPESDLDGWFPARLLAPMRYDEAEKSGAAGQQEFLERVLEEQWWRAHVSAARIVAHRIPLEWGAQFNLYRKSMNPVMTARFMRAGRLAHRSPYLQGLYLAGSSTHPGQWVSFCAISGVLAAEQVRKDCGT